MKLKDLEVERYRLETPLAIQAQPGREVYVHVLVGKGRIAYGGTYVYLEHRRSVFHPPVPGYLIADGVQFDIQPDGPLDVLVASAAVAKDDGRGIYCVHPKVHEIGEGNHKRTVYEILGGESVAQRLRFGETVNAKGGWSSWPPHSFDYELEKADQFEEVFVPFMRPRDGYALMRRKGVFHDGLDVDDAVVLRTGEMCRVPLGSHPIVGSPETQVMYCWAYLSPVPKVYARWAEDVGAYL